MATTYFEYPTQVKYLDLYRGCDVNEAYYVGGIAYQDKIICGCCGATISIEDLMELAHDMQINEEDLIIPFHSWIDIEYKIRGDE